MKIKKGFVLYGVVCACLITAVVVISQATRPVPLTIHELENATYRIPGLTLGPSPVELLNGKYGYPGGDGWLKLDTAHVAFGAVDGIATPAAAVILEDWGGGSGTFVHLVVVTRAAGVLVQDGAVALGDRTVIDSLKIVDGVIVLDATFSGESGPLGAPTMRKVQRYLVRDGNLWQEE